MPVFIAEKVQENKNMENIIGITDEAFLF